MYIKIISYTYFISQEKNVTGFAAENSSDTFNNENFTLILEQMSFTCRAFTTVMAIKHQLQFSLFNDTHFEDVTKTLRDESIGSVCLILGYLEKLASILQEIEVCILYVMQNAYRST